MHQQINLFQPIFREERKLFDAKAVSWSMGAVIAALIALWAFGTTKVDQLEAEVARLREQQHAHERMANTAGSLRSARVNPTEIQARVQQLNEQLVSRSRALEVLRAGGAGNSTGFASKLEALAKQRISGVWIDHIQLGSTPGSMGLGGSTLDADLVPRYLKALATESALQGTRFDDFSLERSQDTKPEASLRFRAGSAMIGNGVEDRS